MIRIDTIMRDGRVMIRTMIIIIVVVIIIIVMVVVPHQCAFTLSSQIHQNIIINNIINNNITTLLVDAWLVKGQDTSEVGIEHDTGMIMSMMMSMAVVVVVVVSIRTLVPHHHGLRGRRHGRGVCHADDALWWQRHVTSGPCTRTHTHTHTPPMEPETNDHHQWEHQESMFWSLSSIVMLRWIYNNNDTMVMILLILIIMVVVVVLVRILETVVGSKCGLAISRWWSKSGHRNGLRLSTYRHGILPEQSTMHAAQTRLVVRTTMPTDRLTDSVCLLDNYIVIVVVVGG